MWLFLLFLAVPLIEIALFIQVGGWIGLWPTLGIVVITAIAGTMLVRSQGAQTMHRLRRSFDELRDPTEPLAHGAMILFSGALLLTPGFFTDAVGFALLVPGFRNLVLRELKKRIEVHSVVSRNGQWQSAEDDVIDGDFTVEDRPPHSGPSGWTRH
ncbi:FxsA protein [Roseibacterium elongatum DSM 19469]|uniref:FxsA protein n=1 Tax=Roseicyclus elongatus DSM 19469 TaxID=1294273 RepID=W8S021_9RHOB|nr:FxsA family protein [Roseibacterium elongatum]AHM03462.1 FxsA protein [Roseibacterium elongatum DSM 19469]